MSKLRLALAAAALSLALPAALPAQAPLTSALHWRSVGPYVGGRVTTVAGIASEPDVYFMGTAGGGVWQTTDAGHSWHNLSDKDFKTGTIGAIAVAPSNPKVIYVGTGDPAPRNTMLTGEGMYKSTDGGKSWSFVGLGDTHIISWILINPTNPDVVYAAALGHMFGPNPERGVYKTTDGGRTWNKVLFVDNQTGAITMAMDPKDPNTLYAAMWEAYRRHWTFSSGGPGSGLFKSTDGGAHWTNISHNPGLPTGIFGKVGVAVAPTDPNIVYALIQADFQGQAGGLFRSTDAGQSWHLVNNSMDITQRAFYYGRVYVDPTDANTIYLPNVGAYVSHDGGKTLLPLNLPGGDNHAFWINPNYARLAQRRLGITGTQACASTSGTCGEAALGPAPIMIEGNDGGATVTLDGGKSWSAEDNQPTGQFYHANLDNQFPFHIYGAQQDGSSMEGPSSVLAGSIPAVWPNVQGGEMSWVVPTPGRPWITYGSGYYDDEYRGDRRTGHTTNVSPFPEYKFGVAGTEVKYRYGWNHHPLVFAPHNPNQILFGANVLFKTLDEGQHWTVISPDLTRDDKSKQIRPGGPISADVTGEEMFDTISSIAVSPLTDNVIWVGSDDGLVHVSTDAGAKWTEVRPPALPTWSTITCIEPSATAAGTAFVSASRFDWDDFHPYVYKTTDYGKHWTALSSGLPADQYVESVRQDPKLPKLMFAATSATVFYSTNGGAHWQPLALNLPAVRVNDIEIHSAQHAVVLATFGRGFYVLDNLQFLEDIARSASTPPAATAAHLFKPQQACLATHGFGGFGGGASGENLAEGVSLFYQLPSDYTASTPVKLTITDASGKLVNTINLPVKPARGMFGAAAPARQAPHLNPGMNRFQWNLRYPNAVDVKGIFNSGFAAAIPVGPEVLPGTYTVTLTVGSTSVHQPLVVTLDPTLHTTPVELKQRFDLLMRIHAALNDLDTALNQAIDARAALEKSGTNPAAVAALTRDIDAYVDLKIQSDEGALVYPGRLRAWLTSIADRVGTAFVHPTPAMVRVAEDYIHQANAAVTKLHATTAANRP